VHRATGLAASIVGLRDRGTVEPGQVADLVLFDPDALTDRATDEVPTALATGVEAVLLAGRFAVEHGRAVEPRQGRVLPPPWLTDRGAPRTGVGGMGVGGTGIAGTDARAAAAGPGSVRR
jgi:N-acyl-D-amino-acid deacylase